jgi:LuxR family maltose regulon positive regulatory protein
MTNAHFQLKTAPPRLARIVAPRRRLEQRWAEIHERTAIMVTAPQGFGKTTLLAQWRRNWLQSGAFVAWATLDAQDDRARFVDLLFFALRAATGREHFSAAAAQGQLQANRELDALTTLLAEVALLAAPVVIVLDDAHRMPQATLQEMLAYLLNNAPPNLQFMVGSRRSLELDVADLFTSGRLASIDVGDLRMNPTESLEILRARFGNRIGLDDAVHLHDLMEGWPLGLQLAASTIEPASDLHAMIKQLTARRGDLQRFFFESVLSRLPAEEAAFLVRISILETINVELCEAVTGCAQSAHYLERLAEETPVLTEAEGRDWLRLHAMARDYLLGQFDRLPADERQACYERAAAWYAQHGQHDVAARHALAAGDDTRAFDYAARCLFDIAREGRLAEANDWVKRLPASAMASDVRLQLSAAWISALGNDPASVPDMIQTIERHPQFGEEFRMQAALIAAAAAVFSDRPGLVEKSLVPWPCTRLGAPLLYQISLANSQATLALHLGDNEQVRRRVLPFVTGAQREPGMRMALGFSDLLVGLSHVMDGDANKAVSVLQPDLEIAERDTGRRGSVAAMLAGPLSVAFLLRGEQEQALATLADRLDVIERVGMPDPTVLAYRTLAMIAMRQGDEARAIEILVALYEIGIARNLPRVMFISMAEQIRLHAVRGRADTAVDLLGQLDALGLIFEQPAYRLFGWFVRRTRAIAAAYANLARSDYASADAILSAWLKAEPVMPRGPMVLVARALMALTAHELGRTGAREALAEVLSLAELGGIRSFVESAHPRLASLIVSEDAARVAADSSRADTVARPGVIVQSPGAPATGGLLTPKEARILTLLATGKANKDIARSMDIGEQTVKWHLKNVFFKLNAASRKHAVDRARLLGLIAA